MRGFLQFRAIALILFITVVNYFDRSAISYAILPLQKEFGLTNAQFGYIAGAFGIGYLPFCFLGGLLLDRFGIAKIWSIAAIVWSVATILTGFSQGFWSLFILRIVLGMSEAVHFPALQKAVTEWLHPDWHSRSVSFALLGIPLASIIGAPLFSSIIHYFNWRVMFFMLGILGIIWVFLWTISFWKSPALENKKADDSKAFKEIFSSKLFWGNCLIFFIYGYILFFALMWLPGYFEKTFHTDILKTGFIAMLPWGFAALFVLLGGFVSDYLWKKNQSLLKARVIPTGLGLFLSAVFFFGMIFSKSLLLDIFLLSLGLGFAFFINAPIYSFNAGLFRSKSATTQGILICFLALSGIISPFLTGVLVGKTENFNLAIFIVSLLALLGSAISLLFQRKHLQN